MSDDPRSTASPEPTGDGTELDESRILGEADWGTPIADTERLDTSEGLPELDDSRILGEADWGTPTGGRGGFFPADGTALTNTSQRGEDSTPPGYTAYQYAVLRFVPRVEREEFVNIGVVVYSQSAATLTVAWHITPERITALSPDADQSLLADQLAIVDDVCAGVTGGGRPTLDTMLKRFGWITAPRSTVLQPGPMHGGMTRDIDGEAQRLLDRLVR